jgi:hypothetical protein
MPGRWRLGPKLKCHTAVGQDGIFWSIQGRSSYTSNFRKPGGQGLRPAVQQSRQLRQAPKVQRLEESNEGQQQQQQQQAAVTCAPVTGCTLLLASSGDGREVPEGVPAGPSGPALSCVNRSSSLLGENSYHISLLSGKKPKRPSEGCPCRCTTGSTPLFWAEGMRTSQSHGAARPQLAWCKGASRGMRSSAISGRMPTSLCLR